MLDTKLFIFFILLNVFLCVCKGCTSLNDNKGDPENFLDDLNTLFEPLTNVIPPFNEATLPNDAELVQEFQAGKNNEDVNLNFTQLVTKYKYHVEEHVVLTSDGYLITIFRVRKNTDTIGIPFLLQHGVECSSDDFIIAGPNSALAYLLADEGYDVWLGNSRGNKYGRRHVTLSPECGEFWEFSFNEIGLYDLPAIIDYILDTTNTSQLVFAGHSEGTTAFFIMCAEKPEYNDNISLMVALSAVVFMNDIRSPLLRLIGQSADFLPTLYHALGLYELLPRDEVITTIESTFCGSPEIAELICQNIIFVASGFDYEQVNATNLPVIYAHYPSGGSVKQLVHYAQLIKSAQFRNYDYGPADNIAKYGTAVPPDYPLNNVNCPVAIFYAVNDWLTSADSTERLIGLLPNIVELYHVPFPAFEHFDYVWAKNVRELVNEEVIYLAKEYAYK